VSAQSEDPAARPADIAEQKLQDAGGADDLHALGLMGETDRIAKSGGLFRAGSRGQRVGDLVEKLGRDAADILHDFGGVAGEMPAQRLKNAARMLERQVPPRVGLAVAFVFPGLLVVALFFGIPAREVAAVFIGIDEAVPQDDPGIGIMGDVFLEVFPGFDDVAHQGPKERDVRTGADWHP
jgi:hypothetical protein